MSNLSPTLSLWENVNSELKNLFPADLYEIWFHDLVCKEESDNKIVLTSNSEFNAIWIENNYLDIILQQARSFAGSAVNVSIEVAAVAEEVDESADDKSVTPTNRVAETDSRLSRSERSAVDAAPTRRTFLNPRNTFENLVVGSGNQLAHAASIAVANAPGRAYNPLFVFGETGLGKTHLMHAVAHQMIVNNPNAKIAYVSTEKFTNEFIHAIRENKLTKFRQYYRNLDALL
ncbi:MAG: DnaA/Hda family protein, partial [Opitutales bacterium]|nr:DnaA/Hda family protein [Opitutales bacterium]